jgi:hypothetical protein
VTDDDLRVIAHEIVERLVLDHPAAAAQIAALVLSEILAVALFGGDESEIAAFAEAVNTKLDEIALHHGAPSSWQLVPADPPRRH